MTDLQVVPRGTEGRLVRLARREILELDSLDQR